METVFYSSAPKPIYSLPTRLSFPSWLQDTIVGYMTFHLKVTWIFLSVYVHSVQRYKIMKCKTAYSLLGVSVGGWVGGGGGHIFPGLSPPPLAHQG